MGSGRRVAADFRPIYLEKMTPLDMASVMEIEMESNIEPWSSRCFLEEIGRNYSYVVVARDGYRPPAAVGYICYWLIVDEVQILNVAVHRDYQHKGIGRKLLSHALDTGIEHDARVAVLEVRQSNTSAHGLYGRLGFRTIGVRPNYYGGISESALLMELELRDGRRPASLTPPTSCAKVST